MNKDKNESAVMWIWTAVAAVLFVVVVFSGPLNMSPEYTIGLAVLFAGLFLGGVVATGIDLLVAAINGSAGELEQTLSRHAQFTREGLDYIGASVEHRR